VKQRRPVGLVVCAIVLATSLGLAAEPTQMASGPTTVAAPPARPRPSSTDSWTRLTFKLDGGVAFVPKQSTGGYLRLGAEVAVTRDATDSRWVWGLWDAYEGWLGSGAGGFAIPVVIFAGYRRAPFVATLGAGLNAFTLDRLDEDTGAGILSPRGEVRLGLDFGRVFVLATSEAQRRWMWGREDITLLQGGLSVGVGTPFAQPDTGQRVSVGSIRSSRTGGS